MDLKNGAIIRKSNRNILTRTVLTRNILIVILLSIITLFLNANYATAQVTITGIDMPDSIDENNQLNIDFYAETDTGSDIEYNIYLNGFLVSNESSFSKFFNYSQSDIYDITFMAKDNESESIESKSLIVNDVPLNAIVISPVNIVYTTRTIDIEVETTHEMSTCTYSIADASDISGVLDPLDELNSTFKKTITLSDEGTFNIDVYCYDLFDSVHSTATFRIDTINPVIISKSYSIDSNYAVTFNVNTALSATCKYDSVDRSFEEMYYTFQNTLSTTHSTIISVSPEGTNNYYIRCSDVNGKTMNYSEIITYNLIRKPAARIFLSKSSPLKAGTYGVNVETSKDVQSISLTYSFNSDSTQRNIFLSGSESNWNGYIIIPKDSPDMIGAFKFSATDFNGYVGTQILDGEIFLVDTTPPDSVSSFDVVIQEDSDVELRWYYEGEDIDKFYIYKSEDESLGKVDFYESVDFDVDSEGMQKYIDKDVNSGTTYYYSVSTVDEAGNEGGLYSAIPIYVESYEEKDPVIVQKKLDSTLAKKIDVQMLEIDKLLLDVDARSQELSAINDPTKIKIISLMKIAEKNNNVITSLESLKSQAESLKDIDMTSSELDVRLNKIRLDSQKAFSEVVEDIQLVDTSSFEQFTQESEVESGSNILIEGKNITKDVFEKYLLENKQIQDNVIIKAESYSFKIKYVNNDDYLKYTIIKKSVSSPNALTDISVVEMIPKEVERSAADLYYISSGVEILKDDPVLVWHFSSISNSEIYYIVEDNIDLSFIKNTKTLALKKPYFKFSDTVDTKNSDSEPDSKSGLGEITGNIVSETVHLGKLSPMHWIIVSGIGVIIMLSVYYFVVLEKQEEKKRKKRIASHRIIPTSVNKNKNASFVQNMQSNTNSKNMSLNIQSSNPVNSSMTNFKITNPITTSSNASLNTRDVGSVKFSNSGMILPHEREVFEKISQCNTLINNMDYESSRKLFNECNKYISVLEDDTLSKKAREMLSHIYLKLNSYRHIHAARKHLYYGNSDSFNFHVSSIDSLYSKLAYNVGFSNYYDKSKEVNFLEFIAQTKDMFEKYRRHV